MIIDISKSKLFTQEPDTRFSNEFSIPRGIWTEAWKRHVLMGYTQSEVREYIYVVTGRKPSNGSLCRWIIRTKIYSITSPIIKKGASHVNSNIFGEYEDYVLKEITKHLKSGASKKSKTII